MLIYSTHSIIDQHKQNEGPLSQYSKKANGHEYMERRLNKAADLLPCGYEVNGDGKGAKSHDRSWASSQKENDEKEVDDD